MTPTGRQAEGSRADSRAREGREGAKYVYSFPRPMAAADIALFSVKGGSLRILLVQRGKDPYKGRWCFPGGFVEKDEDPDLAAARELEEETSIRGIRLEFLRSYGAPGRDPRGHVISHAYLGILPPAKCAARAGDDAAGAAWHPAWRTPPLAFDHKRMLGDALARLRDMVLRGDGAFRFLPPRFPLEDLRGAFQAVTRSSVPAARFAREIKRLRVLEPVHGGLFRLRRKKLAALARDAVVFNL